MSLESVVVRRMVESDLDEAVELIVRLKSFNEELDPNFRIVDDIDEVVKEYLKKSLASDRIIVLVAVDEGNKVMAGVVRVELVDRLFYEPRLAGVITDLYVRPQYRRKRLGRLLIEKAMEEARKMGAGILTVIYPAGNQIADSFYTKMGFIQLNKELYKACTL
ncbi:MAG: GNAT family N-acetyltransferase [Acidilobus sp.]